MQTDSTFKPSTFDDICDRCEDIIILGLDDEDLCLDRVRLLLETPISEGEKVQYLTAKTKQEALSILTQQKIHVMLLDVDLGKDLNGNAINGIQLIPDVLKHDCSIQILMMTGSHDLQNCAEAMRLGAFGYLTKDMNDNVIRAQIAKAAHVAKLERDKVQTARAAITVQSDLAGRSAAMKSVRNRLQVMAETNRPVLLIGETGTGKSHSARLAHEYRKMFLKQKDRPFFAVNIAELGKDRIENELFGHEKGAYTGADQMKQGYLELADGGTLFLDEIGEAPLELQAKLLKVLDERKFRRLGSGTERTSNFQLICATNRSLEEMVQAGEFREDLYMRISTLILRLPTLKERQDDIPDLIRALLPKACVDNSIFVEYEDLPTDFIDYLKTVPFNGNVRGLEQQLSRLLLFAPRDRRGRPLLQRWREVSGMSLRKNSSILRQNPQTLADFISQTLDFHSPEFPGYLAFMDDLSNKIFKSAFSQLNSAAEVARIFKLSQAAVSNRRKILRLSAKKGVDL